MLQSLWFPVLYGLVLFLLGMKIMESALQRWAGPMLHQWLNRATSTPLKGMLTSTVLTAVLQSSSAVTVLTIGFANAGLLGQAGTLGIILGTNIGTTLTTELISLQIGAAAFPLLLLSLFLWAAAVIAGEMTWSMRSAVLITRLEKTQYLTLAVAGFALVLLGIKIMQSIGPPLQELGIFQWFLEHAGRSMIWGIIAGAALTALMHSSAAVIAMTMSLALSGSLPPVLGVAIVLGSNVGTCVTALMAAAGSGPAGRFVAWSHLALNIGGVLLFAPLLNVLTEVSGALAADPGGQIAHAQTIFNVVCSLLALPLCYLPFWKKSQNYT
ncbi:Na/Pi cotransporter family protein [Paenibacillus lemnae]|uniref:Na/Pi cotransporter family protein n=1 Tax=Paenibacillus lemnae TaxID=1330551 RepID=A0A848M421_PAELE|nr:Na/Pi symporter [Paenibacillus lemnae]NMO94842.1 Na/Pi cotransporter family protein [Paenibacillus lemnae]